MSSINLDSATLDETGENAAQSTTVHNGANGTSDVMHSPIHELTDDSEDGKHVSVPRGRFDQPTTAT